VRSLSAPLFVLGLLLLLSPNSASAQQTRLVLEPETPVLPFAGQNIEVIGWVTHVETSPEYGHQKAFLQSGDGFYAYVRGDSRREIGQFDLESYKAKRIRLSGTVGAYEGAPHIIIETLDQFSLADAPEAPQESPAEAPTPLETPTNTFALASAGIAIPQISFEATPITAVLNRWIATVAPREESVHITERPAIPPVEGMPDLSIDTGGTIRSTQIVRPTLLGFGTPTPRDGSQELREVSQFMTARHADWPTEQRILFSSSIEGFREDGLSGGLGWALIAESIKTGEVIPENVAAVGNLDAEGNVLPVYGMQSRLESLARRGIEIAIIPRASAPALIDLAVDGQLGLLQQMQVIAVEDFDQAWHTTLLKQGSDLERSILLFEEAFQLQQADAAEMQNIGTLNPNHASAYVCYLAFTGQLPNLYTLQGSWERLRAIRKPFDRLLSGSGSYLPRSMPDSGTIKTTIWDLQKLRKQLDPQLHPYHDALEEFIEVLMTISPDDRYGSSAQSNRNQQEYTRTHRQVKAAESQMLQTPGLVTE